VIGPPTPEQPRHIATRDSLLVLLTLTTGAVDVSSFLHLGNVFHHLPDRHADRSGGRTGDP
jgi:hypothetical protein